MENDNCGNGGTAQCPCCGMDGVRASQKGDTGAHTFRLRMVRKALLYDIENAGYLYKEVTPDEAVHLKHVMADIGQKGNIDVVDRALARAHAIVVETLFAYTRQDVGDADKTPEEIDDRPWTPEEYRVDLHVPADFSRTTAHLLARWAHDFMVAMSLADYLRTTLPQVSTVWEQRADEALKEIVKARSRRSGTFTRPMLPW